MPETNGTWSRRAVLLAGGLLIAGCGGPQRPFIQSEDYDSGGSGKQRLGKLLQRRAAALRDRDERAYLADLDGSNDELMRYERLVFANLRQFELAEVRHITEYTTEQRVADGESRFGPVIRVLKLTADAGPGDIAPAESFVYQVKGDVVTGITRVTIANRPAQSGGAPAAEAPWHTDALKVVQVGEKVWLAGDRSVADLDRYAAVTERELGVIEGLWGDRLTYPGHVLFFTRDKANFRQWYGYGSSGPAGTEALGLQHRELGVGENGQVHQGEYAASRIVVNLRGHGAADPSSTIRHELAHAVSARATMAAVGELGPPTWAVEGFARYTETVGDPARAAQVRSRVAAGVRSGRFRGTPPSNKDFYGRDAGFNYDLGASVFSLAERLKGRDAAVELYARVIERPSTGASFFELPIFDRMARDVLGLSAAAFRGRWDQFVRNGA
ncbi:hypothetical protein [Nonomuraea candida]|uniref:hypothetical protein n=1 Tax=Nonomuraea candida TaxID=359159 RepID=UPI0005BB25BA|nr:hypothetical protein [Nonomuraea candida]